jgi:hypothetical protein
LFTPRHHYIPETTFKIHLHRSISVLHLDQTFRGLIDHLLQSFGQLSRMFRCQFLHLARLGINLHFLSSDFTVTKFPSGVLAI